MICSTMAPGGCETSTTSASDRFFQCRELAGQHIGLHEMAGPVLHARPNECRRALEIDPGDRKAFGENVPIRLLERRAADDEALATLERVQQCGHESPRATAPDRHRSTECRGASCRRSRRSAAHRPRETGSASHRPASCRRSFSRILRRPSPRRSCVIPSAVCALEERTAPWPERILPPYWTSSQMSPRAAPLRSRCPWRCSRRCA